MDGSVGLSGSAGDILMRAGHHQPRLEVSMKPIWSGALLLVLILAVTLTVLSCKGKSNPVAPGAGADVTIDIVADMGSGAFGAAPETVLVNQTVSWRNTRGITHTATANGGQFNTGNIGGGTTSVPIKMTALGSFPYSCLIHPSMTGTLVVK